MASTKKTQVQQLLAVAAAACEDKKAEDIRILALDPSESGLTDYFLICTGLSDRQNVAITDEIEIRLKRDFGTYPNSVEGRRQGEWILMDYVDFIVHVFSAEKRAFYGLERLRKSATVLSIDDLNAELKSAITAGRKKPGSKRPSSPTKEPTSGVKRKVAATKKASTSSPPPKKAAVKRAARKKAGATKVTVKAAPKKTFSKQTSANKSSR
jgi:ribosome-associated protein